MGGWVGGGKPVPSTSLCQVNEVNQVNESNQIHVHDKLTKFKKMHKIGHRGFKINFSRTRKHEISLKMRILISVSVKNIPFGQFLTKWLTVIDF